jgi:hypothetical protein
MCYFDLIVANFIDKFEATFLSKSEWPQDWSCPSRLQSGYRTTNGDTNKIDSSGLLHNHKDAWKLPYQNTH